MTLADKVGDLSMLWKQVSLVFPYFDRLGFSWDEVYKTFLSKVLESKTDREFHLLLAAFMNRLGDGHTDYLFPKTYQEEVGYLPFTLRQIQNSYCIDGIIPEKKAYAALPITAINGVPFSQYIQQVKVYAYHVGDSISRYGLHRILPFFLKKEGNLALTPEGSFSFHLLPVKPENLQPRKLTLPESYEKAEGGKLDIRLYGGNILYIRMDDFLYSKAADEVEAAIRRNPTISGVLLDLRENIGGMTRFAAKVAELFISGEFHACQKRTRTMNGCDLACATQILGWREGATEAEITESESYLNNTHFEHYMDTYGGTHHKALFTGPCLLLTSRHTVSAAEDFVAMFRTNARATILGTPTCGTTGTPLLQSLSCGGSMRVCSVGYQLLDGTEFVGRGIDPDILLEGSLTDFRRGYDAVQEKALAILKKIPCRKSRQGYGVLA